MKYPNAVELLTDKVMNMRTQRVEFEGMKETPVIRIAIEHLNERIPELDLELKQLKNEV